MARHLDRLAALSGAVAVVLVGWGVVLADPSDVGDAGPASAPATVASVLRANAHEARIGARMLVVGVLLLVVFAARLHAALRASSGPGAWEPVAALAGVLGFAAVLSVDTAWAYAASETSAFEGDPGVAMVVLLYGWNSGYLWVPFLTAAVIGTTVAVLRWHGLPRWVAWVGAAVLVLTFVSAFLGAVGATVLPAMGFLVLCSLVLGVLSPRTRAVAPSAPAGTAPAPRAG